MITVSVTEIQKNFGKYLQEVQDGEEIIILKNGREVARLISHIQSVSFLTDSLVGVLKKWLCKEIDTIRKDEKVWKYWMIWK